MSLDTATREKLADEERRYSNLMQAIGDANGATHARMLNGEDVPRYRARLASKLQHLDPSWKESNLLKIADVPAALDHAVHSIYDTAERTLQRDPGAIVGRGVLREIKSHDSAGRPVRRFYGDPLAWMGQFMGGAARFCKINRNPLPLKP